MNSIWSSGVKWRAIQIRAWLLKTWEWGVKVTKLSESGYLELVVWEAEGPVLRVPMCLTSSGAPLVELRSDRWHHGRSTVGGRDHVTRWKSQTNSRDRFALLISQFNLVGPHLALKTSISPFQRPLPRWPNYLLLDLLLKIPAPLNNTTLGTKLPTLEPLDNKPHRKRSSSVWEC